MADSQYPPARLRAGLPLLVAAWLLSACGPSLPDPSPQALLDARDTGTRMDPSSEVERQVLSQLEAMPSEQARTIGGTRVVASPTYFAASGHPCRRVAIGAEAAARHHLACKGSSGWYFVPSVFEAPTARR